MYKKLHIRKYAILLLIVGLIFLFGISEVYAADAVELSWYEKALSKFFILIGSSILWLGGLLFDSSISYYVIGMGKLIQTGEAGLGSAITKLWAIIRDLFNIFFIFGLIFVGFKTILNSGDTSTRKTLGLILAAALLINFSLYATKAIVDFSNVAAFQIYKTMDIEQAGRVGEPAKSIGISAAFMEYTNIDSYIGTKASVERAAKQGKDSVGAISMGFIVMIFMLITGFVLIAGAVFMVTRFILLIIFMIFSPAMFLGWIFPGFAKYSSMWWSKFLNQAFLAPAFLFMLYLSLKVLKTIQTDGSINDALSPDKAVAKSTTEVLIFFVVAVGFMIASLMVAKQMGAAGASQAIKIGKGISNKARGFAVGGAGYMATGALGGMARFASRKVDEGQASGTGILGERGRSLVRRGITAAESAKIGGSASSKERRDRRKKEVQEDERRGQVAVTKNAILEAQKAQEKRKLEEDIGGMTQDEVHEMAQTKEGQEKLLSVAGSLTSVQMRTIQNSGNAQITKKFKDKLKKDNSTGIKDREQRAAVAASAAEKQQTAEDIGQLSTEEVVAMMQTEEGRERIESIAGLLSPEHFEAVTNSTQGQVTEAHKQQIKDARFKSQNENYVTQKAGEKNQLAKEVSTMSNDSLYEMARTEEGRARLKSVAGSLSLEQLRAITGSRDNVITLGYKKELQTARAAGIATEKRRDGLSSVSDDEILRLARTEEGREDLLAAVGSLTPQQVVTINESTGFSITNEFKDKFKTEREAAIREKETKEADDKIIKMEERLAGATTEQIIEIAKSKDGKKALLEIAGSIKSSHMDAIYKSQEESVGEDFKEKLRTARAQNVVKALKMHDDPSEIRYAVKAQLNSMDYSTVMENSQFLQDGQLKDLDDSFTPFQVSTIRKQRKDAIETLGKSSAGVEQIIKSRKGEKEIALLPDKFLESKAFANYMVENEKMSVSILEKIANESDADKPKIKQYLKEAYRARGNQPSPTGATGPVNGNIPDGIDRFFRSQKGSIYG